MYNDSRKKCSFVVAASMLVLTMLGSFNAHAASLLVANPSASVSASRAQDQVAEVIQARQVLVDTRVFNASDSPVNGRRNASIEVDIDLFGGTAVSASLRQVRSGMPGMLAWSGKLTDDSDSDVTIVVNGGIVQSNIHSGKHGDYQIRYLATVSGENIHSLREIDPEGFPEDHPPEWADIERAAAHNHSHDHGADLRFSDAQADTSDNIDIMVVYTSAARTAVGGTSAMETLIGLATTATNNSYSNSNINTQLSVVHTAEVSYTESGSFFTDLDRLEAPADGYMDNVHSLRSTYQADMVGLLTNSTSFCGLATEIMATAASAFQVTYHGCATGNMSFAHEFGHLQGARHDWANDSSTTPYVYGHGYTPGSGWRTVMSYSSTCTSSCPRIQHWSNPDVNYSGAPAGPTGVNGAQPTNNALVLNNTAYTVANFVQSQATPSLATPAPSSTLSSTSQTFSWTPNGANITEYTLWVGDAVGNSAYYSSGALSGAVTSASVSGLPEDGSTVYVRLWFKVSGSAYQSTDYTYTAFTAAAPEMLVPVDGSSLSSGEAFIWNSAGAQVSTWVLWVGSTDGARDIYNSGQLTSGVQNQFVSPIVSPTGEVHTTLYYKGDTGPWKSVKNLYYVGIGGGFDEQFSATMSDWTLHNGWWSTINGRARVKDANAPGFERSSISRTGSWYADVDYTARVYRNGSDTGNANALVVRSSGGVDSAGYCQDCYVFQWSKDGQYSVWKRTNGASTAVQAWASASAISTGWNTVRVVMVGANYWLIINGELLSSGSDSTHTAGMVGIAAYKSLELDLWVDYATLDVPTADVMDFLDSMQVTPEQQDENNRPADGGSGSEDNAP